MFYSELLSSPINSYNVKRIYGVNPDTEPARALAIGIYPLTEVPEGYRTLAYNKDGDSYTAVPSTVTVAEEAGVYQVRAAKMTMEEALLKLKLPQTTDLVEEEPAKKPRAKTKK